MSGPMPPFTEELEEFRAVVRRYVETELRPHAAAWEDAKWFPDEVFPGSPSRATSG
jgi:acyl-CoA dehydrogenase